jgi:hypothetical protein
MAALARDLPSENYVDDFLSYLTGEWEAVPELAREWSEWSDDDRFDFSLDWPIREDRLQQLDALARDGRLLPEQQRRYARLLEVVAEQRPLLDQLFVAAGLPPSGPQGAVLPPRP